MNAQADAQGQAGSLKTFGKTAINSQFRRCGPLECTPMPETAAPATPPNTMNTKNTTFVAGLAFLIYGALFLNIPDWDIGVSLVMAFCTYCTADWVIQAFRERRYKHWPLAVFFVWFSVDGSYFAYWSLVNEDVMVRGAQWLPSLMMYLLCGIIWTSLPTWKQLKAMA